MAADCGWASPPKSIKLLFRGCMFPDGAFVAGAGAGAEACHAGAGALVGAGEGAGISLAGTDVSLDDAGACSSAGDGVAVLLLCCWDGAC